jgi:trimeric autotransporter adhesin
MKTIRAIATILLAAFMVLGPLAAHAAASTMTLQTNAPTYSGQATIIITGTISPAPTIASSVVITTRGPVGAVDIGTAAVATGTGAFTYSLVSGGSATWVTGAFTVNGTWGAQGNTATMTASFLYSAASGSSSSSTTVTATVTQTVTSAAATVTSITTATTTATATITAASGAAGNYTAQLNSIQSSLNALASTMASVQSSLTSISNGVSGITNTLSGLSTNLTTLNGVGSQLNSLNGAVSNNQTYVLVVAALAAITLVLELAILVRKLS